MISQHRTVDTGIVPKVLPNFFFFYANKAGCGTALVTRKEHLVALCSGQHACSLARVADGGWLLAALAEQLVGRLR